MKRIEIVANQAIEEDLIEIMESVGHEESFTYLHPVYGRGKHGRREGSAVWPETNVMFIVYMDDETARLVFEKMKDLKKIFPSEGIKCWLSEGPQEVL